MPDSSKRRKVHPVDGMVKKIARARDIIVRGNTGIPACAPSGVSLRCRGMRARVNCAGSGLQTRWAHRPQACVPAIAFRMDLHREEDPSPLRDCDLVNIAPLQLGEELSRIHGKCWSASVFFGTKTFATSASNRGVAAGKGSR